MTTYLLLFLVPIAAGMLIFLVGDSYRHNFHLMLAFAGSYLFSITIVHILPELYGTNAPIEVTGLFVLAGFFLQQFLEYFTSGVEHGHLHHAHHHGPGEISSLVLLSALCLHSFLEGGILVNQDGGLRQGSILLGILLHKAPAAFAMMTVLASQLHSKTRAIPHLVGFSIAAPLGLFIGNYLSSEEILTADGLYYVYAVVSGSFLYISTTIVFESQPDHRFSARKLAVTVAGAILAVAVEYIV